MKIVVCLVMTLTLFVSPKLSRAELSLPAIFSDNMVLQQESVVPLWGWAAPGGKVSVLASWAKKPITAIADAAGRWQVMLKTGISGDACSIRISAASVIEIKNVMLGEVWLCGGQSNMYFPLGKDPENKAFSGVPNAADEIKTADHPSLRMFLMERVASDTIREDVKGKWFVCSPETAAQFSAVGYFFGLDIMNKTKRPVGLIRCCWGGSTAEAWLSKEVLEADTTLKEALLNSETLPNKKPAQLYNAMLKPIVPYGIRGVLWYQGEANMKRAAGYQHLFTTVIRSWRKEWKKELSFYFVQLPPYQHFPPLIREAQLETFRSVKHTGMVVITDAGDSTNIHPTNKKVVGERLALWALAHEYGQKVAFAGPVYSHMKTEANKLRLFFNFAAGVLAASNEMPGEIEIAGADGKFLPAQYKIEGPTLVVWSDAIHQPVEARYSWRPVPRPALSNGAGLLASPFRTANAK